MSIHDLDIYHIHILENINRQTLPEVYDKTTWYHLLTQRGTICLGLQNQMGDWVGYICVLCGKHMYIPHGTADWHIASIAILPSERRKGYGTLLIQEALSRLDDKGSVDLFVRVDNHKAIQLYQSMGFVQTGTIQDYYEDKTDAYIMTLKR